MAWWQDVHKGFASGYFMAVSSSGSFVFAWTNQAIITWLSHDNNTNEGEPQYNALALTFYIFGGICFALQFLGALLLLPNHVPTSRSVLTSTDEEDTQPANKQQEETPTLSAKDLSLTNILFSHQFWLLFMMFLAVLTPVMGVLSIFVSLLSSEYDFSQSAATTYLAVMNVVGTVMRLFVGLAQAMTGTRVLFYSALLIQVVVFVSIPFVNTGSLAAGKHNIIF